MWNGASAAPTGPCHTLRAIGTRCPARMTISETMTVKSHDVAKHDSMSVSAAHTTERRKITPIPPKSVGVKVPDLISLIVAAARSAGSVIWRFSISRPCQKCSTTRNAAVISSVATRRIIVTPASFPTRYSKRETGFARIV